MIIVRLEGGLGNSMFQYALGRYLAHRNNTSLKFDIHSYEKNPIADCSLWLEGFHINIANNLATGEKIDYFKCFERRPGRLHFFHNLFVDEKKYVKERYFHYDPEVPKLTGIDMYIHGWWQSEKYFLPIRDLLLNDFATRSPLNKKNADAAEHIRSTNSIGMHVRRADYVKDPVTRHYHGELKKQYFDEALSYISSKISNPILFIFSDDIEWVKHNFVFPIKTVYVDWNGWKNGDVGHEDLRLMSLCKHNIISNSTLAWWGAWLNRNKEKIVVAPAQWFAHAPKNDARDIIPDTWIKIPSYFKD